MQFNCIYIDAAITKKRDDRYQSNLPLNEGFNLNSQ